MNILRKITTITLLILVSSTGQAENLFNKNVQAGLADEDKDGVIDARDHCQGTPLGSAVDNNGCSKEASKLLSLNIDILFETGKSDVSSKYYPEVMKLADFLKDHPKSHAVIEGHTDNKGPEKMNEELSQQRASAIRDILVDSFRINPDRVKAIGYGETRPIDSNETPEGRAKNRRVIADVFAKSETKIERWTIYSVDKNTHTAFYTPHQ